VLVVKLLDEDADPGTLDDQEPAADWEFDFAVGEGASIGASGTVTDETGVAFFEVFFETEASEASITEILQEDFDLIDVECLAVVEGKGGEEEFFEVDFVRDGSTITFEIFEGELIECFFVNAAQEVAVASPTTPPPAPAATPTLPASSVDGAPPTDRTASLAPILLLLALGASVTLLLVPAPRRLRR
jgi:hypothetical protein